MAKEEKQCEELRKNQSTNSTVEVERLKREYEQKNNELCIAIETLQNAKNEITVQSQVEAVKETAKLKNELMTKIQKERIIAQKEVERLRSEAENLQKQNELAQQKLKQNTAQMQQLIDQMINELQSMRDGTASTVKKFPSTQYDMCVGK